MIKFSPNQPPYLTVYAPPAWNNPDATQLDFMQYSIPNKGVLPVGTMMQFPTGAQPSDWSLVTADAVTTDNQWQSVFNFNNGLSNVLVRDALYFKVAGIGYYFLVTSTGISKSTDGINYTEVLSKVGLNSIAYNKTTGELCVTVDYEEPLMSVYISSNLGATWIRFSDSSSNGNSTIAVCEAGTSFVVLSRGPNYFALWKKQTNDFYFQTSVSGTFDEAYLVTDNGRINKSLIYEESTQKCYFVSYIGSRNASFTTTLYSYILDSPASTTSLLSFKNNKDENNNVYAVIINLYLIDNEIYITIGDNNISNIGTLKNANFSFLSVLPYKISQINGTYPYQSSSNICKIGKNLFIALRGKNSTLQTDVAIIEGGVEGGRITFTSLNYTNTEKRVLLADESRIICYPSTVLGTTKTGVLSGNYKVTLPIATLANGYSWYIKTFI